MSDKKIIITGLLIFVVIITLPIWYNLIKPKAAAPEPKLSAKAEAAKFCIVPKEEMKAGHMQILDAWRDTVVRKGERVYISSTGRTYNMSLSTGENSCMGCHTNKAEFCDSCHNYASVRPYCWDCHNEPKESK